MDLTFNNYGQERDINATSQELKIFEYLATICPELELCRKADNYLTATIHDQDVARFKFTPRAKWIRFPNVHDDKITLSAPSDIENLSDMVADSVKECIRIYEEYVLPKQ